jgi:hypothetical protein
MQLDVDVTQEDILQGIPNDEYWCPIARAVRRIVPGVECVTVDQGMLSVVLTEDIEEHLEAELPPVAKEFVAGFDETATVLPFKFSVALTRKPGWGPEID